jgi:8-oxo-dGTP pyrophosphatase MutT (NUDIX family)
VNEYGRHEVLVHLRRGEDVLLLHRSEGKGDYWHPVAGGVEAGEDWHAAALRELQEETGLTAVELREIGHFDYVREPWEESPGMRVACRAFAADAPPEWEPTLNGEHDRYRWCSLSEAESLLLFPEPKELLRKL